MSEPKKPRTATRKRAAAQKQTAARPRMTPVRSAAVRKTNKGRRRKRAGNGAVKALIAAVCVIAALCLILFIGRQQQLAYQLAHRFDGYPLRYTEEVNAAAEEFDVEPAYLYAVIHAESSFRPDAESSVGALGLMQIMPDTGAWLAKKLDLQDSYTPDMLTDPAINVRMGSWYLHFLLDRYHGDKRCASAAYHAGQGTVDNWLNNPEYSTDGVTLSVIAYDSTNYYVNKVLKNYENYLALLSQQP